MEGRKKYTALGLASLLIGFLGLIIIGLLYTGVLTAYPLSYASLGVLAIVFGAPSYAIKNMRDKFGLVGCLFGILILILGISRSFVG